MGLPLCFLCCFRSLWLCCSLSLLVRETSAQTVVAKSARQSLRELAPLSATSGTSTHSSPAADNCTNAQPSTRPAQAEPQTTVPPRPRGPAPLAQPLPRSSSSQPFSRPLQSLPPPSASADPLQRRCVFKSAQRDARRRRRACTPHRAHAAVPVHSLSSDGSESTDRDASSDGDHSGTRRGYTRCTSRRRASESTVRFSALDFSCSHLAALCAALDSRFHPLVLSDHRSNVCSVRLSQQVPDLYSTDEHARRILV